MRENLTPKPVYVRHSQRLGQRQETFFADAAHPKQKRKALRADLFDLGFANIRATCLS